MELLLEEPLAAPALVEFLLLDICLAVFLLMGHLIVEFTLAGPHKGSHARRFLAPGMSLRGAVAPNVLFRRGIVGFMLEEFTFKSALLVEFLIEESFVELMHVVTLLLAFHLRSSCP